MKDAKLIKFDDETRKDHSYLRADDDCYFFIEWTAKKGYSYSDANGFMSNLKKNPSVDRFQLKHKLTAIREAAETLAEELPEKWLKKYTFVPVPPSKSKKDDDYDDRMSEILTKIGDVDVRELVYQLKSMDATHTLKKKRHKVSELAANYKIAEKLTKPEPTRIVIVDDMVTAGAHYRAMCQVLRKRFPEVPISGVFLARRIFAGDEEEEDADDE